MPGTTAGIVSRVNVFGTKVIYGDLNNEELVLSAVYKN